MQSSGQQNHIIMNGRKQDTRTNSAEHIIIDALTGIRIVHGDTEESALNSRGNVSSSVIDPAVLQSHKSHRLQLLIKGATFMTPRSSKDESIATLASQTAYAVHRHMAVDNPEPTIANYVVVKLRPWLVGYTRILSLHSSYFSTLDPTSFESTNKWYYHQIRRVTISGDDTDCLLIDVTQGNVDKNLKLKCLPHDRTEIISKLFELKYQNDSRLFHHRSEQTPSIRTSSFNQSMLFKDCQRLTRRNTRELASLLCTPYALIELDYETSRPLKNYFYKNILSLNFLQDDSNGLMITMQTNCKIFFVTSSRKGGNGRSDLISILKEKFSALGLILNIKISSSLQDYWSVRKDASMHGEPYALFKTSKFSERLKNKGIPIQSCFRERELTLTENGFLIESDLSGNHSCMAVRSLNLRELRSVNRYTNCTEISIGDGVHIEFHDGCHRDYFFKDVGSFLSALCDSCKTWFPLYNTNICPYLLSSKANMIVQRICLNWLHHVCSAANTFIRVSRVSALDENKVMDPFDECQVVFDACLYFLASHMPSDDRILNEEPKLLIATIQTLWETLSILIYFDDFFWSRSTSRPLDVELIPIFQSLHALMLISTKFSYAMDTAPCIATGLRKLFSLIHDPIAAYWFLCMISVYAGPCEPIYDGQRAIIIEAIVHCLLPLFSNQGQATLPQMVASSIIEKLIHSHRLSTSFDHLSTLTSSLSPAIVFQMFKSHTRLVVENALIFAYRMAMYSGVWARELREQLLSSCIVLHNFYLAIFCPLKSQRYLSRLICSFCLNNNHKLLEQIIPSGFLEFLKLPLLSAMEEEELDTIECEEFESHSRPFTAYGPITGVDMIRLREKLAKFQNEDSIMVQYPDNFRILFHTMRSDHHLPDLLWNRVTIQELKESIEAELVRFHSHDNEINIVWNFHQFIVYYPSLVENEVRVGSIYLRALLQSGDKFIESMKNPNDMFESIFRKLMSSWDNDWSVVRMCVPCLNRIYLVHNIEIGPVPEHVMIILRFISITFYPDVQYDLLLLLATLVDAECDLKANAETLINHESVSILCELVASVHSTLANNLKSWFLAPANVPSTSSECILGPFPLLALRTMLESNEIDMNWFVSAGVQNEDKVIYCIGRWRAIGSVWELRMQVRLGSNTPRLLDTNRISLTALKIIHRLVTLHDSVDCMGRVFSPIPIAKQLFNGNNYLDFAVTKQFLNCGGYCSLEADQVDFLSIIVNCIFCYDASIIDETMYILQSLLRHNQVGSVYLHRTGFFFFALMLLERIQALCPTTAVHVAEVLLQTHTSTPQSESALSALLPEGLTSLLSTRGPEAFITVYLESLSSVVAAEIMTHIGDFPQLLQFYGTVKYDYQAISKISYEWKDENAEWKGMSSESSNYSFNLVCDRGVAESIPCNPPLYDPPILPQE